MANAGQGLQIESDIIQWLTVNGYIDANGEFPDAKWNDLAAIFAIVPAVEAILQKHGVQLPPKVLAGIQAVTAIIPLVEPLFK